jgi:hypothetical protein
MDEFKQSLESPLNPPLPGSLTLNPFQSIFDSTPGLNTLNSTPLVHSPFSQSDVLNSRANALLPPPPGAPDNPFGGLSSAFSAQSGFSQPAQQPNLTPPTPTFIFPKRVFQ